MWLCFRHFVRIKKISSVFQSVISYKAEKFDHHNLVKFLIYFWRLIVKMCFFKKMKKREKNKLAIENRRHLFRPNHK